MIAGYLYVVTENSAGPAEKNGTNECLSPGMQSPVVSPVQCASMIRLEAHNLLRI